jgi:hypothetical protein
VFGDVLGSFDGSGDGLILGWLVGASLGDVLGSFDGAENGLMLGDVLGSLEGAQVVSPNSNLRSSARIPPRPFRVNKTVFAVPVNVMLTRDQLQKSAPTQLLPLF